MKILKYGWLGVLIVGVCMAKTSEIVLIVDPRVLALPVGHSDERLVDFKQQSILAYGPSPEIPNNQDYTYVRQTVYDKLVAANRHLPNGYHFCLYEGYRSLALQKLIFDKQFLTVQQRHPDWSQHQVFQETIKLVSPVMNLDGSANMPPHAMGSAIDVYLLDDEGQVVDMGIHPKDWMTDVGGVLSMTHSTAISKDAQAHRRLMSEALATEGFVNYPTEYWHWSYGDRYWAYVKGEAQTIYDAVKVP